MNLKNYTSDVPAHITISRIQAKLMEAKVSSMNMEYGISGETLAITFGIQIAGDKPPVHVRMPADVGAAQQALWLDYVGSDRLSDDGLRLRWPGKKKKTRADFLQQGERTAWKLMQDWIEVQFSMIQLKQADFMQVFLPYAWDGKQTLYQRIKSGGYAVLMPPKEEPVEATP